MITAEVCKKLVQLRESPLFRGKSDDSAILDFDRLLKYLDSIDKTQFPEKIPDEYVKRVWELAEEGIKIKKEKNVDGILWDRRIYRSLIHDLELRNPFVKHKDYPDIDLDKTPKKIGRNEAGVDIIRIGTEKGSGAVMVSVGESENVVELGSLLKMSQDEIEIYE